CRQLTVPSRSSQPCGRSARGQSYWLGDAGSQHWLSPVCQRLRVRELLAVWPGGFDPVCRPLGRDREPPPPPLPWGGRLRGPLLVRRNDAPGCAASRGHAAAPVHCPAFGRIVAVARGRRPLLPMDAAARRRSAVPVARSPGRLAARRRSPHDLPALATG